MIKKDIIIISVRDKDGYYIPVLSSNDQELIDKMFIDFKEKYKNNKYFDLSYPHLETIIDYYEFIKGKEK